jgi:hypothetical protein
MQLEQFEGRNNQYGMLELDCSELALSGKISLEATGADPSLRSG